MPRSLHQAGIGNPPFFVRASDITQPFYVTNAIKVNGKFGEQVNFTLRLRDGVMDDDGNEYKNVTVSLAASEGQRAELVRYFSGSNDPLGPCLFNPVPSSNGLNDFYLIVDADAAMLAAIPREVKVITRGTNQPALAANEDVAF